MICGALEVEESCIDMKLSSSSSSPVISRCALHILRSVSSRQKRPLSTKSQRVLIETFCHQKIHHSHRFLQQLQRHPGKLKYLRWNSTYNSAIWRQESAEFAVAPRSPREIPERNEKKATSMSIDRGRTHTSGKNLHVSFPDSAHDAAVRGNTTTPLQESRGRSGRQRKG